jgi:recombination protein RecT
MGNSTQLTKRQRMEQFGLRLESGKDKLAKSLPATVTVEKFIDVAQTALLRDYEELSKCTDESLFLAVKQCAQAGLMPDGKESAIVRYGNVATWMPMVVGIIRSMLRSADVAKVESRAVRAGDRFEYHYGLRPILDHVPLARPSGTQFEPEVEYAYAVVFWKGLPPSAATFEVVTREEIEAARTTSRAPESPAWRKWYSEMARKVALHRVSKYVDLAPEAQRAIEADIAAGWDAPPPAITGMPLEEKMRAQVERDGDELKRRLAAQQAGREPIETSSSVEEEADISEGEREPTPAEAEKAEEGRRRNWWRIIDNMIGAEDSPLDEANLDDAMEFLFGGASDVVRDEHGVIVRDSLDSEALRVLVDELVDRRDRMDGKGKKAAEEA